MSADLYGLPITCADPATARAIDDFIHGFVTYQNKAVNILPAAEANPDCGLAQAYAGMLWMFLEAPEAPVRARGFIDRALALADGGTEREALVAKAVDQWARDDIPAAIATCEGIAQKWPRDLAMVKLGQYLLFNRGDSPGMLRMALRALPGAADIAQVHGMVAFGYEQCHLLAEAEASARQALEMLPEEPWAHHALAHVMLTQGRIDEGCAFLESVCDSWEVLNSFIHTHNWWHLALFHLSRGRTVRVLEIYDRHVWGIAREYSQDQVGAVSLLARMELAGIDVGSRWEDVADHVAARGVDLVNPFLTMQYLYALGRAGRDGADALMQAVIARGQEDGRHDHAAWAEVAVPACAGVLAHARGEWRACVQGLGQALPRMAEAGGSHAQRDLFEQLHLDALIHSGALSRAQQVLELRRGFDPDGVPLNRALADVYDGLGLPALAAAADARAAATLARG